MKNVLYLILFLGQTIGDATILSHLIPLFRRLVTSGLHEKTPPKILVFAALGVNDNPGLLLAGSALVRDASAGSQSTSWSSNSISITA